MTHHYRHWFNTAILRRVAVFTLSMFESVAPLTQGQETADEEEEVLESLVDSPKTQDDKKKELEALLQEPETDGTDSDSESDADAEGGETMTATLSDSELYLLGLALDEQNRTFEQKLDGTQATTDKLAAKAIADMQATPIPVGLTRSTDSPFSGQSTEAGGPTIVEDAISHDTDKTAALLISSDDDDSDTNYGVQQSYSPLSGSLISTTGGTGSILSALSRSSLFSSGGSSSFSSSGSSAAGGGGGGGGASGGSSTKSFSSPLTSTLGGASLLDDPACEYGAPKGDVTWNGNYDILQDGQHITFDNNSTVLDFKLSADYRPWLITVNDNGVTPTKRGDAFDKVGYAIIADGGQLLDYVYTDAQEQQQTHATSITKEGDGILVLELPGAAYSGGVEVNGGTLYVAAQGSAGTGTITLHDDTAVWVNYTWDNDYSSSFRNPVLANNIILADGTAGDHTSSTISYGDFVYHKVLGNNTSRTWRNLSILGNISGNEYTELYLQGYTSRFSSRNYSKTMKHLEGTSSNTVTLNGQVWYSGFILNKGSYTGESSFSGTVYLQNHTNDSLHTGADNTDDRLSNRYTGAVKLTLSDDLLGNATLDMTRDFAWMKESIKPQGTPNGVELTGYNNLLLNGRDQSGKTVPGYNKLAEDSAVAQAFTASHLDVSEAALRQTYANILIINGEASVGELKADFLGVTQDSYLDTVNWSEANELKLVRVVTTEANTTLTLGKETSGTSWFSGTMGLDGQLYGAKDGYDILSGNDAESLRDSKAEGSKSVAGLNLTKVGSNSQYIHTAELRNLTVHGGTVGFNNLTLNRNLEMSAGTTLRLGVQDEHWTSTGSQTLEMGTESGQRFNVLANAVTEGSTTPVAAPVAATVEGNLTLGRAAELNFDLLNGVTPYSAVKQDGQIVPPAATNCLLYVDGTLSINSSTAITLHGMNFLEQEFTDNTYYFLAAANEIADVDSFGTRVIKLDYGYYGLISTINTGETDYLVMRVATDPTRSWSGSGKALGTNSVTINDKNPSGDIEETSLPAWLGSAREWSAPSSDPNYTYGERYLVEGGLGDKPDQQWKENRAYVDGVSVKFGNLYVPTAWQQAVENGTTWDQFTEILFSGGVTKVGTENGAKLFSKYKYLGDTGNGVAVVYGLNTHGADNSAYNPASPDSHYEQVIIKGEVRPGYVTVNSDYELANGKDGEGKLIYKKMVDDTNYVFSGAGHIADAPYEVMAKIYGASLSETELRNWRTSLSKGGTGVLVIQTQNWYSGGSKLTGGLTVMQNQQALGWSPESLTEERFITGGDIEMSNGAGLMVDYISKTFIKETKAYEQARGELTNSLLITHAPDYDNSVTGDAQLFNRYNAVTEVSKLSSYSDAVLTLRGMSLAEDDELADGKEYSGRDAKFYTFADYMIKEPEDAYGTIRMAGYLYRVDGTVNDGRLLNADGKGYAAGGGKVQLTISGHNNDAHVTTIRWEHITIDLSLNGGEASVLALETRFLDSGEENTTGAAKKVTLGTLTDDGKSGDKAYVINDASSERLNGHGKYDYLVNLTLDPAKDTTFSGNIGYGIGQNAEGAALPSRGYISLTKTGTAYQSIGSAKLKNLVVGNATAMESGGTIHFTKALSACSISNAVSNSDRIFVGGVDTSTSSHTLVVGKGGILAIETEANFKADPFENLLSSETDSKYGKEATYILLQDGATITAAGNWKTNKAMAVQSGAEVTFNTHEYQMDDSITSSMATTYTNEKEEEVKLVVDDALKQSFNKSHIIQLYNGTKQSTNGSIIGHGVTVNFVNEQISAGAKEGERGGADYIGYVISRDLNKFVYTQSTDGNTIYLYGGLTGDSVVNIGSKTILQINTSAGAGRQDFKEDSEITYNISGTDAALQFIDSKEISSYIYKANLSSGGSVLLGGKEASADTTVTDAANNATKANINIRNNVDLVITTKADSTEGATMSDFELDTANTSRTVCGNTITVETALGGASDQSHASMKNAQVIAQTTNNLLEHTDLTNTLVEIQQNMTLYISDVTMDTDSKVKGAAGTDSVGTGKVVNDRPRAQSNAYTDTATRVSVTLTQDNANTVTSNTQNKLQVMKVDQLKDVDMLGIGLTIGISQETLESYRATCDILALEVTDTGIFTYEANGMLSGVQLADTTTGNIYATTDTSNPIAIADSAYVAYLMGVEKSQVSMNYIYIVLPEPTTGTLSLLAMAALCARRRRTGAGKV